MPACDLYAITTSNTEIPRWTFRKAFDTLWPAKVIVKGEVYRMQKNVMSLKSRM